MEGEAPGSGNRPSMNKARTASVRWRNYVPPPSSPSERGAPVHL